MKKKKRRRSVFRSNQICILESGKHLEKDFLKKARSKWMNNLKKQELLEMREFVGLRYKAKRQADEASQAAKNIISRKMDQSSGKCDICLKDNAEKNFQQEVEMNYVIGFSEINKKPHN